MDPMFRGLGRETRRSRPGLIERPVDLSFYGRSCDQLKYYGISVWNQIILRSHWCRSRLVGGVLCVPGVAWVIKGSTGEWLDMLSQALICLPASFALLARRGAAFAVPLYTISSSNGVTSADEGRRWKGSSSPDGSPSGRGGNVGSPSRMESWGPSRVSKTATPGPLAG
jgi:hypothetical protein